jgi:hypothetical protein
MQTVSTSVTVDAETPEEAIYAIDQSDDMPGSITHNAFGSGAAVDEAGEWAAYSVTDADGAEVWARPDLNTAVAELLHAWPPATLEQANELIARLEETWKATWL